MLARMTSMLTSYFAGEKSGGLLVATLGLVVAGFAAALWRVDGARPFAATLAVFAIIELGLGIGLYVKTGPQVAGLETLFGRDAAAFFAAETPRMIKVQRNFVWLEVLWLVLIALAAGVAVWKKQDPRWSGIALGVLVNVSVILAFDVFAERRGADYLAALQRGSAAQGLGGSAGSNTPTR
jgi:hypothetical protein